MQDFIYSIREKGIIQPITVTPDYVLVAGGRRLRACQELGMETIPCIIRKIEDELDYREIELIENAARKELTWHEQARLEKRIYDLRIAKNPRWTLEMQGELSDTVKSAIHRRIELANAIDLIPELASLPTQKEAWKRYHEIQEDAVVASLADDAKGHYAEAERYASDHYKIGDAFEGMKGVDPGTAFFAEVDPPYAIDLAERKGRNISKHRHDYREVAEEDYGVFCKDMARLVYRALRSNAFCVWWYADEWGDVIRDILEEAGFSVSSVPAIWYKGQSGQTLSPDTMLASSYEPFFVARKGQPRLRKSGRSNVFEFSPLPALHKIHPTERPIELMLELLETFAWPGAVIVSPFLGSGSILRACYQLNMVGYGWDIDAQTKHRFMSRVHADTLVEKADEPEPAKQSI
jgi:DNA modification methylase